MAGAKPETGAGVRSGVGIGVGSGAGAGAAAGAVAEAGAGAAVSPSRPGDKLVGHWWPDCQVRGVWLVVRQSGREQVGEAGAEAAEVVGIVAAEAVRPPSPASQCCVVMSILNLAVARQEGCKCRQTRQDIL